MDTAVYNKSWSHQNRQSLTKHSYFRYLYNLTPTLFSVLQQMAVTLKIRVEKHHQTLLTEFIFIVQYQNTRNKLCSVAI